MRAHQLLFITFCGFLACNLFDLSSAQNSSDLIIGAIQPGDRMIEQRFVEVPYKVLQIVKERITLNGNQYSKIHCIRALNRKNNGHPAKVTVEAGGTDQTYVTLLFKSERGHGIHYNVELWGR